MVIRTTTFGPKQGAIMQKPNKITSKGTSWKRRGAGIIAVVALTVTAGIGAGVAGSAGAAGKSSGSTTTTSGGQYSTNANAGWGG